MPLCSNVLALDRSREVGLKGRSARLSAVDACSGDDVAVELEKLKVTSIKIVWPSATVISLITGTCKGYNDCWFRPLCRKTSEGS